MRVPLDHSKGKVLFGNFPFLPASYYKEEGDIRRIIAIWVCTVLCISILVALSIIDTPIGMVGKASGATLFVNKTGSGGAYTSIQDAVDAANPGDTIFVYSGKYNQDVVIEKTINLRGENQNNTIIQYEYSDSIVYVNNAQYVNVSDFTITNNSLHKYYSAGIYLRNSTHCTIENNTITRIYEDAILLSNSSNNHIVRNKVSMNGNRGILLDISSNNNTIIGNIAYMNGNNSHGPSSIGMGRNSFNNTIRKAVS